MLKRQLNARNRVAAIILAVVWAVAGTASLVLSLIQHKWIFALLAPFALVYSVAWIRVAVQARLLSSWREIATPWRVR